MVLTFLAELGVERFVFLQGLEEDLLETSNLRCVLLRLQIFSVKQCHHLFDSQTDLVEAELND